MTAKAVGWRHGLPVIANRGDGIGRLADIDTDRIDEDALGRGLEHQGSI